MKLDPTNTELLSQKQRLLSESIKETETRLDILKQADKQAKTQLESGNLGQDKYDALQREIIATEQKLKGLKDSASDMANGVEVSAQKAGNELENIGKKLDFGNFMEASEVIAEAGEKIIDFGKKTAGAFSDLESASTRVNTYFGLTGKAAEEMGGVVENVFKTGVTDSLEEVGEAVITVNNNLKDLSPEELESITNQAINMEQVFGIDMNESMRGVNALMTNFGMDAQTAMDYLVTGTQNGLDKTQELGDNLSEYAGKFSQAGYSASEYFQLLQNGLDGGAYNLDKVNDSINEVTTRLADGTIADSIGMFSQNTQDLFAKWQEGGATQKDVINSIVSDIGGATTQQEALTMAATAFGTMGEDANLEVVKSLTTLGDSYIDVGGSAQQMADDATTPMQTLQSAINELQIALAPLGEKLIGIATEILPPIVEAITSLIEGFMNLPGPVQTFLGVLAGVLALLTVLAPIITTIVTVVTFLGSSVLLPLVGIIAGVVAAITTIILIFQNWGAITEWFGEIWNTVCNLVRELWDAASEAVKNAMESLKAKVTNVFENIKNTASNIWKNIKNTLSSMAESAKNLVSNAFSALSGSLSSIWDGISGAASSVWEGIKDTVSNLAETAKTTAVTAFENLKTGISDAIDAIPEIVSGIFDQVVETITGMIDSAYGWGADFIGGLKDGIMAGVDAIVGAVKSVADKIASFLHFSRPDKGPLHYYEQWMPDMIHGLASGIVDNIPTITKATNQLANAMAIQPTANTGIDYSQMAGAFTRAAGNIRQTVYIDERSFKRGLRGMGVEFGGKVR